MLTNKSIGSYGRWGNMAFQMAAVIAGARKSGQPFGFAPIINHDHRDRFGSCEDVNIDNHFAHELPRIDDRRFEERHFGWGYSDIYLPAGDWDIRGHFQSPKYWTGVEDEIRYWLTFKDEPPKNGYVAIHYRAGDYLEGADNYHPRCSKEYYQQAMALFPGATFLLFSDDKKAFYDMMGEYYGYVTDSKDYIEDFKLMKSCHSFICANSSFSYIAALLANQPGKQIVMPRQWFGAAAGGLQMDYPENAIVI